MLAIGAIILIAGVGLYFMKGSRDVCEFERKKKWWKKSNW